MWLRTFHNRHPVAGSCNDVGFVLTKINVLKYKLNCNCVQDTVHETQPNAAKSVETGPQKTELFFNLLQVPALPRRDPPGC